MPRYWRSILVAPGDVRRIRAAAELTQSELAAELELANVRSVERYERAGAVFALVSSLLASQYNATRFAKLERVANRAGFEIERVDALRDRSKMVARLRKYKTRHFAGDRGGKRGR